MSASAELEAGLAKPWTWRSPAQVVRSLSLSAKLVVAMVGLVLFTAAAVVLLTYRIIASAIVPQELARLEGRGMMLARELDAEVRAAGGDVLTLRGAASLDGFMRASLADGTDPETGLSLEAWRERLASLFDAMLEAKPVYLQVRLIGIADDGRELVRVERTERGIRRVAQEDLQMKGHRPYVTSTIAVDEGQTYVSRIGLNQEDRAIETPYVPVLRTATPVRSEDQQPFGILVINVDMRAAFERLRQEARLGGGVYVIGEGGEYLVHPKRKLEFGIDLGHPARLRDDFPELAALAEAHGAMTGIVTDRVGQSFAATLASMQLAGGPRVAVLLTMPREMLVASAGAVQRSSLIVSFGATLAAMMLAALVARSLTRPLSEMATAVNEFTGDRSIRMPTRFGGEIGALARAFARMATDVRERTAALEREVDERRRAQLELERVAHTERLYHAVVESSEDAIVTKTLDGIITGWNQGAERLYGYSADEVIGQSIEIIVPTARRSEVADILAQLRAGRRIQNHETIRVHKSGREIEVSLSISPIRSATGEVVGAAKIARDVTERNAAEEKFRIAVEASPSGMIMIDQNGTVVLANREAERLFGFSAQELIGQSVDRLVPADARAVHAQHRLDFMIRPEKRRMGSGRDLFGQHKDGHQFLVEIGLNPIELRGGPVVLAAIIDITERRRAEDAVAQQAEELRRSNAELEQFAYIASHDLREPLRMVASYTELLADRYRGQLDERADKYIHYASDGARRMQRLVSDLLRFSQVGTRGRPLCPTDANVVVHRQIQEMQPLLDEVDAEVALGDLPVVLADEVQLEQVVQSLLSNALKFRSPERKLKIEVGAVVQDGMWVFAVADNGIGIEEQYAGRIFQMFQRLHERGKYEGSGIGLAIANKIVQRHGGAIWFRSTPGHGSTFYFSMPRVAEDEAS